MEWFIPMLGFGIMLGIPAVVIHWTYKQAVPPEYRS